MPPQIVGVARQVRDERGEQTVKAVLEQLGNRIDEPRTNDAGLEVAHREKIEDDQEAMTDPIANRLAKRRSDRQRGSPCDECVMLGPPEVLAHRGRSVA